MKNSKPTDRKTTYSHQELAVLYFPEVLPGSASRQLTRWILKDPDLVAELARAGYTRRQRMYSPLQAAILIDHLGHPETRPPK